MLPGKRNHLISYDALILIHCLLGLYADTLWVLSILGYQNRLESMGALILLIFPAIPFILVASFLLREDWRPPVLGFLGIIALLGESTGLPFLLRIVLELPYLLFSIVISFDWFARGRTEFRHRLHGKKQRGPAS